VRDLNTSKLPNSREHPLQLKRRRISPALEHRVLKGKTWLTIRGSPADQRRPHRLQRRGRRLRWTKRTWNAMVAAAQTAAAAEAAAASLDLHIVDGWCRRLEARDTRHRAATRRHLRRHLLRRVLTASACLGPKARKHDNPFSLLHRRTKRRETAKVGGLLVRPMFLHCFGFLDSGETIRILLFD